MNLSSKSPQIEGQNLEVYEKCRNFAVLKVKSEKVMSDEWKVMSEKWRVKSEEWKVNKVKNEE